jgi:RNA polymerase sigma-70 factor (ECF subfamily)
MPALEREAFELVVFGGVAQEQAARALGVAPTAFRMRLSRARRKLRAVVQDGEDLEVAAP